MPPRYARTMEDVNDAEEAELDRLIRGFPAGSPASPTPFNGGASAPRLDAPSSRLMPGDCLALHSHTLVNT